MSPNERHYSRLYVRLRPELDDGFPVHRLLVYQMWRVNMAVEVLWRSIKRSFR